MLSAVALVFALQYKLDELAINEAVGRYAYVGTVYGLYDDLPFLREIPEDIVRDISESPYVSCVENRRTLSGRADKVSSVLDYYMTRQTLDLNCVLEGKIMADGVCDPESGIENGMMTVQKLWGSVPTGMSRIMVNVKHAKPAAYVGNEAAADDEPCLHKGDKVLLTGRFEFDYGNNGMNANSVLVGYRGKGYPDTPLEQCGIYKLPDELSRTELDEMVAQYLEEQGLTDTVNAISDCRWTFTLREISDMSMLMGVAQNSTFVAYGRGITPEDAGKKVCVINQFVASKNWLYVGDTINLAVADGHYSAPVATHDAMWDTGYPKCGDELLEYGEYEPYEIIGIYNFKYRDVEEDLSKFSRNDIFIPASDTNMEAGDKVTPYNFSFRIMGPDYEDFMDEFELSFAERGYKLMIVDTGWEDFSDSYLSMMTRRMISLVCAVLTFLTAVALFLVLVMRHFKYEFGLRRLMGASYKEAAGAFITPYFVIGLPSVFLAVVPTYLIYDNWLAAKMAEVVEGAVPSGAECIGMLMTGAAAEFVVGLVALMICSAFTGRKNLLKLIK